MLARIVDQPFSHQDWLFEPKLDGYRILAFLQRGKVTLLSRNGLDYTGHFSTVVGELESHSGEEMVLDGELVALDESGLPDFGLLQQTLERSDVESPHSATRFVYYPFDLLHHDGVNLQRVPLLERKKLLARVLIKGDHVQPVEYLEGDGESFYQAASQLGLEGVVAKRRDSIYEPGMRSRSWLKVKAVQSQEFVVGGCTPGEGARSSTFGALLVGYYDVDKLRYAGRVGSGFDRSTLQQLQEALTRLKADVCPFVHDPELDNPENRWVRPELVARVKFAQWTEDGRLRAPVFMGLRSDLDPQSVGRDTPEPATSLRETQPQAQADRLDADIAAVLDQLSGSQEKLLLDVAGHRISLTNLKKPLWPAVDGRPVVTKGDMIRYYVRMSPALVPHLRDRPLTFTRYPNGIQGKNFYQKHWHQKLPSFVETVRLFSSHNEGDGEYIMVNNLPTLVWLAQLANIELHPWLSRTVPDQDAGQLSTTFTGSREAIDSSVLNYPDFIVFDLDPYIYSGEERRRAKSPS